MNKNKDTTYTFKKLCEEKGAVYSNALYQRKKHPSLTDLEVIECCLKPRNELTQEEREKYFKDKKKPFRVQCEEKGIAFSSAYMFKSRHPNMSDDDIFYYYISKAIKKLVFKNDLDFEIAYKVKETNPKITDTDLILKTRAQMSMLKETGSADALESTEVVE